MKYAIYDKAADGYLTKMEFEVGYSEHTQFECGLNEYITEAKLLDTKEKADAVIADIESFKFMEKGRFVIHSFDDTLKDQYIISEAGTPTKVVDSITVDLDGNINVKYGTMVCHWSASSLEYAINRMNRLQEARSPKYSAWCNTFDIYKVIPVIDERSCGHYQFIKVTEKGLTEYAKDEVEPLNKRIEELELANYNLGEMKTLVEGCANRLQEEKDSLKAKVESITKEAHNWKKLYENVDGDRSELKNAIDIIHMNLVSPTACDDLKDTLKSFKSNSGLDHISMDNFLTAKDEMYSIIEHIIAIYEANDDLKNSEIARLANERDNALERAEKFKGIANSVYGMTIPSRCCGKQVFADVMTRKKILIDKKKYDDLVEYVANINLTYDTMFCMMDKPVYLSTITDSLNNLTK